MNVRATRPLFALCAVLATACGKPPPEAPDELGDLSIYLFENFDAEDVEVLQVGTQNLEDFLSTIDLTAEDVDDRAFTLPILAEDHFGGITGSGYDVNEQIPVGEAGLSRHDLEANMELVAETNHVCIESGTTVSYDREFLSDLDCFMDGTCETVETVNEVLKRNTLASIWYDQYRDYRLITLEDGRDVLYSRLWLEDVFDNGGNASWDQTYTIEVSIPDPDDDSETIRYVAMWSSITLFGIGGNDYAALVKNGIDESLENTDDFIDTTDGDYSWCSNDRDEEFDRD
jgi:hypothetical protein